jgi:hypothetical protein
MAGDSSARTFLALRRVHVREKTAGERQPGRYLRCSSISSSLDLASIFDLDTGTLFHEIVPHEKIVSLMYFSDSKGNKIDPAQLGIEHEAIEGAYDVTIFEDLGNGQTKLTFIGNEPMESAKNSGQLEGWNQILDKLAAVVAGLTKAK